MRVRRGWRGGGTARVRGRIQPKQGSSDTVLGVRSACGEATSVSLRFAICRPYSLPGPGQQSSATRGTLRPRRDAASTARGTWYAMPESTATKHTPLLYLPPLGLRPHEQTGLHSGCSCTHSERRSEGALSPSTGSRSFGLAHCHSYCCMQAALQGHQRSGQPVTRKCLHCSWWSHPPSPSFTRAGLAHEQQSALVGLSLCVHILPACRYDCSPQCSGACCLPEAEQRWQWGGPRRPGEPGRRTVGRRAAAAALQPCMPSARMSRVALH